MPENPPVVLLGHRDQAHDPGLAVPACAPAVGPVDCEAVEEEGRLIVGHVGTGVVEPLHGGAASGQ